MKDKEKDVTNLQDAAAGMSEEFSKSDKMSVDTEQINKDGSEKIAAGGSDTDDVNADDQKEVPVEEQAAGNSDDPSWEEKYAVLNDSHLRLMAEYDNFRKRTVREKADLIKSGGATVLTNLLPVIDDFERAMSSLQVAEDIPSVVEGVRLIYDKFISYLSQQGVTVIDAVGQPFDTELFEAIATIPAPDEDHKGKVIDCVQTGYKLYDRVLRHAKVVVGE